MGTMQRRKRAKRERDGKARLKVLRGWDSERFTLKDLSRAFRLTTSAARILAQSFRRAQTRQPPAFETAQRGEGE